MSNIYSRQTLNLAGDTGTGLNGGDTGPVFFGEIMQMRWNPDGAAGGDTGGDLFLSLIDALGDTAGGWLFYSDNDCLGSQFTKVPLQPGHASDGFDTGVDQYHPIVSAGQRIRAKTAAGVDFAGKLHIWTKN
jgi:hypothetical protein